MHLCSLQLRPLKSMNRVVTVVKIKVTKVHNLTTIYCKLGYIQGCALISAPRTQPKVKVRSSLPVSLTQCLLLLLLMITTMTVGMRMWNSIAGRTWTCAGANESLASHSHVASCHEMLSTNTTAYNTS